MAGTSRFISLEEVLELLQIDRAELDQIVADGKLSPVRDAGKLKFRREQIEAIRTETETEATVVFESEAAAEDDSSEDVEDGLFIVGDGSGESSDDEPTIISIPSSDAAADDSDNLVLASDDGSDEDSDQTSIIPPSSDNVEPVKEDEESIFSFGSEDITLEDTDHIESDSESDSDIITAAGDSSSDIIAADDSSSSDIITAAEDSSSDILSVSVEGDDGTETVSDILELSDESDDALASVQLDSAGADEESTASEEVVGSVLETIEDAESDSSDLLAIGEEGLETADTIDLTVADDDATATVAEVLEEPDATEAGVLTATEETLEGVEFGEEEAIEAEPGPVLTDLAVPEGFVFGEPPKSLVFNTVLLLSLLVMLFAGTYLVTSVTGAHLPFLDKATEICRDFVCKIMKI